MPSLDDPATYGRLDAGGTFAYLREYPRQCGLGWERGLAFPLDGFPEGLNRVVVLGMGGSAIAGDLLGAIAEREGRVSVTVQRDYNLPFRVDNRTLVIASSYSGATEETLSAFRQALTSPCPKLALTRGGALQELAEEHGVPVLPITYRASPRLTLGFSLTALLALFQRLGLVEEKTAAVQETISLLSDLVTANDTGVEGEANFAKGLAGKLFGRLPVIYAGAPLHAVARRWKTQLNENAKVWAFFEALPEAHHNAVVGLELPTAVADLAYVLLLQAKEQPERLRLRYALTEEILQRARVDYSIIEAPGEGILSQLLGTTLLGDYVSCYLALLNGRDPWPVEPIDYLKARLAKA